MKACFTGTEGEKGRKGAEIRSFGWTFASHVLDFTIHQCTVATFSIEFKAIEAYLAVEEAEVTWEVSWHRLLTACEPWNGRAGGAKP